MLVVSLCVMLVGRAGSGFFPLGEEPERIASRNHGSEHWKNQQVALSSEILDSLEWWWGIHINVFVLLLLMVREELRGGWNMGWVQFFLWGKGPKRNWDTSAWWQLGTGPLMAYICQLTRIETICTFVFHWRSLT